MQRGDKVIVRVHGIGEVTGFVVEPLETGSAIIDIGDGDNRQWSRGSFRAANRERAPRGAPQPNDRALKAAELAARGMKQREIAEVLGVKPKAVASMLERVRDAEAARAVGAT